MFCHLTLRGRPAPKRTPEVVLTSSQSRLSSALPRVKVGGAGGAGSNSQSGTRVRFHSFCASLDMSPKDDFFFPKEKERCVRCAQTAGKQRSGAGWPRLMPSVKWCWHAEGLLWEVVIHHDLRMTQKLHSAFGVMVWDPWLMWAACVCPREAWEEGCTCLCAKQKLRF